MYGNSSEIILKYAKIIIFSEQKIVFECQELKLPNTIQYIEIIGSKDPIEYYDIIHNNIKNISINMDIVSKLLLFSHCGVLCKDIIEYLKNMVASNLLLLFLIN